MDFSRTELDLAQTQPVILRDAHQTDAAEQGADTLGDGGGQGGRTDTVTEITNQQKIQSDVDESGENQVVQGVFAVTQSMENANKNIVQDGENHTIGVIPEVGNGLGKNCFGGLHPPEDGGGKGDTQKGQQRTGYQAEGHVCVQRFPKGVMVFGTETFCDEHTGTHGDTLEEADHHVNQAGRGTDCCQCGVTQIVTDYPGVKGIIKLLKEISQKNWKSKQKYLGPDGTISKVLLGGMRFVLVIVKSVATEWHVFHFLKNYWFCYTPGAGKSQYGYKLKSRVN